MSRSGTIARRALLAMPLAAAFVPRRGRAQARRLKIGVLTDMTGPYALTTGHGSVIAAQMAAEDFARTAPGFQVDIVAADNKSDANLSKSVATEWLDHADVSAIVDVPGSTGAFEVARLVEARNRVALFSGAGSARLTGALCGPNHVHWTYDTWALAHGTGRTLAESGGKTWFFITADYDFGHQLEQETTQFVTAAGGSVVGGYAMPFPGNDFSNAVVQAVASGANVIGLANAGADTVACIRAAASFGVTEGGQRIAALLFQAADVHAAGLPAARGLVTTEAFYWDRDDASRTFAARFAPRDDDAKPGMNQAGVYAATLHYLKAVAALGFDAARASGRVVVDRMKAMPTDDPLFGAGSIRLDGRKIHDLYLFQVKTPMESREPWDVYSLRATIPAAQAFRPMAQGGCRLVPA
jgi:branched-chain amino acid transport system substrate-binding protein